MITNFCNTTIAFTANILRTEVLMKWKGMHQFLLWAFSAADALNRLQNSLFQS